MRIPALLLFLALFAAAPTARADNGDMPNILETSRQFRGTRITDIEYKGDAIPDIIRARIESLKGRPYQASTLRTLLLWVHENGGDFMVDVRVESARGGARLIVEARQRRKISDLRFEGNVSVGEAALEPVVEMKEGSEFERDAAEAAVQKLGVYYGKQGYLATEITYAFDPATGVLRFLVKEGQPTLLHSFGISPLVSVEKKDLRARYERELKEAFGLELGDRIQRDRVLEGIQRIKDWLRDHDFLMARDPVLEYKVDEEGRVGLFLNIEYGPRIRFGFRGNTQFSYRELMMLVGEIKEVASGSDYLSAVRRRILEAYKEIGLANAQINTLVKEDPARGIRYVSLIVDEGKKIRIERFVIEGVYSMDQSEAVKQFKTFATRLVQRDFFDEEGINKAADLFAEYLQSQGYLSAKLEYVKFDFNPERTRVLVSLLYTEGVRTSVQDLELDGVKAFSREEMLRMLSVKPGEPFNIFAFEKGLNTLKEAYGDIGHLSAQIVNEATDNIVSYSRDNSQAKLRIEVDEGPVFQVGEVLVRGNQKTHARVILREMPFITNDVLTAPLLAEAEDNLRKLNLFSSVILRPIDRPGSDNVKDILILVEESAPGYFDVVPGLRSDLGLRLGFELGYQNLGGWNRSVNAQAVFNRRLRDYRYPEYLFSLGFREPYLANWPVAFTANLTLFRRIFESFDADVNRITLGFRREIRPGFWGFLEYNFERNKITNVKPPYIQTDQRTDIIGSITPGFSIDSRDDRFNPTRGVNSTQSLEIASNFLGSSQTVGFYRFTSYNSAYFRLFDGVVLALAANIGWERSNVEGEQIPTFKLFRLGGMNSIRGYREDSIEAETSTLVRGTLALVNYRTELRIPISGSFGTALFLDAGNLLKDSFSLNPALLKSSVGAGLRYITPVGPVVLDFAWRLQTENPAPFKSDVTRPDNDRFRVHFAIGAF